MDRMDRALAPRITADLSRKIVLLSERRQRVRQSGKTTLARMLVRDSECFDCDLVILDELRKMKNWKPLLESDHSLSGQ